MKQVNLSMFKQRIVLRLKETIPENLERYREGDFQFLMTDSANFFESPHQIDIAASERIVCTADDRNEVACTQAALSAFPTLTPYVARDERLWVYLTHIVFLEYARCRWQIPDQDSKAIPHIKRHFFASGARGIERDNAISRLWWMAFICNRVKELPLENALNVFLHKTDVRANIIERPTTSQILPVLSSVLKLFSESYDNDEALYDRKRYRPMMKELNLQGGIKLLEVLEAKEVDKIIRRCASKA